MRLAPIVDKLISACPLLRSVQSAFTATIPAAYPAAYVLQLSESVHVEDLSNVVSIFHAQIAVEIHVKHSSTAPTGGEAQDDTEDVRSQIIAALTGFKIDQNHGEIGYTGGKLLTYEPGFAAWRDEFTLIFKR